jgi:hypothetical protein
VNLAPALAGHDAAGYGVDVHGAVFAVAGGALGAAARRAGETRVLRWEPDDAPPRALLVRGEPLRFNFVQPLGDGMLLVASRTRGTQPNALALDEQGRARARFTLGDGIEDVRVTPDGTIWVSYFDEGVYGNEPLGAAGLNAFTATGELRFQYRADAAGSEPIDDCYALNVSGDGDVWIHFYNEFPIVRIHDGRYHLWHTSVAGASALAVRGKRALLYGDYDRRDVVRVLELGAKGSAVVAAKRPLVDAAGAPFAPELVRGVGASLYCFHHGAVSIVRDW